MPLSVQITRICAIASLPKFDCTAVHNGGIARVLPDLPRSLSVMLSPDARRRLGAA